MLKFLSRLGQLVISNAAKLAKITPKVEQVAHAFVPDSYDGTIDKIFDVITHIEVAGQALALPGAEKLKGATPLVAQAILRSPKFRGMSIEDQALFTAGCEKIASGMADIINSLDASQVDNQ